MKKQNLSFLLSLIFMALPLSGCMTPTNPHEQLNRDAGWVAGKGDISMLTTLLAKGVDPNLLDANGASLLVYAANEGNFANSKLLVVHGADIDQAVQSFEESNVRLAALNSAPAREHIARQNAAIALLGKIREEARVEVGEADPQEEARFVKAALDYRQTANKPVLPEEARKFKVQAEGAVRDKKFDEAAKLYSKALNISPWWPEGHFNRAIVLGENRYYLGAIREMNRYLTLVPNALDARAAQDKIYEWERKSGR